MSDIFGVAQIGSTAMVANVAKTVLQLVSPANHRVKVLGWGVFFDGVSTTAQPVQIRVMRQTTAGTMTALTPTKTAPRAESILCTAQQNATTEPSNSDSLDVITCHPQQGYEIKFPQGQEIMLGGSDRIGIEVLSTAIINVRAKVFFEE